MFQEIIKDKRILITGGAGFIGSHLVETLKDNNNVIIYDKFLRNSLKYMDVRDSEVEVIEGDVLDFGKLSKVIKEKEIEILFHFAAVAGIETITKRPLKTMEINLLGAYNALKASSESRSLERFVFSSTSEVYGPHCFLAREEDKTVQGSVKELRWIYSVSKLAAENFAYAYYVEYGLPITIVRLFNVYGPRQTGESAIHNFVVAALRNKPIMIHGDGLQIRAWCYIEDALKAILLSAVKKETIGEIINIGNPKAAITIYSLAKKIVELAESNSEIIFVDRPLADVALRIPSVELARSLLGYEPKVDLEEGLSKTIEWYRANFGDGP
jgi:dTDP-glucose 4,6-dehydratase